MADHQIFSKTFLDFTLEGATLTSILSQQTGNPFIEALIFGADPSASDGKGIIGISLARPPAENLQLFNPAPYENTQASSSSSSADANMDDLVGDLAWDPDLDALLRGEAPPPADADPPDPAQDIQGPVDDGTRTEEAYQGYSPEFLDDLIHKGARQKSVTDVFRLLANPRRRSQTAWNQWTGGPTAISQGFRDFFPTITRGFNVIHRASVPETLSILFNQVSVVSAADIELGTLLLGLGSARSNSEFMYTIESKAHPDSKFITAGLQAVGKLTIGLFNLPKTPTGTDARYYLTQILVAVMLEAKVPDLTMSRHFASKHLVFGFLEVVEQTRTFLQKIYRQYRDMIKAPTPRRAEDLGVLWIYDPTRVRELRRGMEILYKTSSAQYLRETGTDTTLQQGTNDRVRRTFRSLRLWFLLLATFELTAVSSIYAEYGNYFNDDLREISGIGIRYHQDANGQVVPELLVVLESANGQHLTPLEDDSLFVQQSLAAGRLTKDAYGRGQTAVLYQLVCGQINRKEVRNGPLLQDEFFPTVILGPQILRQPLLPASFAGHSGGSSAPQSFPQFQYKHVTINQVNMGAGYNFQFWACPEKGHLWILRMPDVDVRNALPSEHAQQLARLYYKAMSTAYTDGQAEALNTGIVLPDVPNQLESLEYVTIQVDSQSTPTKRIIEEVVKAYAGGQGPGIGFSSDVEQELLKLVDRTTDMAASPASAAQTSFYPMFVILGLPEVEAVSMMLRQCHIGAENPRIGRIALNCDRNSRRCHIFLKLVPGGKIEDPQHPTF
ncbi:hypothetical protein ABW21_db0204463 [Orbilia brochopaga]|nr:hypothetical protein ABW21_db0204463 [Drechslerella brochopaga]